MLRTLKVISYRATHFLSFLIIIMVINVYKLKSLTPDERSRGTQTREQTLCTFTLRARARTRRHPPLPARLASLSTLPSFPPPAPRLPRAQLGTECPQLAEVVGTLRAQGQGPTLLILLAPCLVQQRCSVNICGLAGRMERRGKGRKMKERKRKRKIKRERKGEERWEK